MARQAFGTRRGVVVLCNSYPKSGTHLLFQVLSAIPGWKPWADIVSMQALSGTMNTANHIRWKLGSVPGGSIVRSHLMYCPEVLRILAERTCTKLFIYRDLRDVALSHAMWVSRTPRYFLHPIYAGMNSDEERVMASIVGVPLGSPFGSNVSQPSIAQDFERWKGWLGSPGTLSIRFEDLVGHRGGGDEAARQATIRKILGHLGVEMPAEEIGRQFSDEKLEPSKSLTFRKGAINDWRAAFTSTHKAAFKAVAGNLLIELGYEKSNDW
jgi:hypothetical protein